MSHATRLVTLLMLFSVQGARADCDADLATFKAWHRTLNEEGPGAPISLVPLTGPSRPSLMRKYREAGPGLLAPLWVEGKEWIQSGKLVRTGSELRSALKEDVQVLRDLHEAAGSDMVPAPSLPIGFRPDTPWSTVVEVLAAAEAAGMERTILLFAGSSKLKTPAPAPNTKLAQRPGDWSGWENGFTRCPPLTTLQHGAVSPQDFRTEWLVSAWGECRCAVPLADLQNWVWGYMERFNSPPRADRLLEWKGLPGERPRPSLALPAKLTWAEAWKQLEPVLDKSPVLKVR